MRRRPSYIERAENISPRAQLIIQGSTWLAVAIVFAFRLPLATGDEISSLCPLVLDQIFDSDGYPVSPAGYGAALSMIGVGWFLTGVLMLIYKRWPRGFLPLRVAVAKTGAPVALRAGGVTFAVGVILLVALQLTC